MKLVMKISRRSHKDRSARALGEEKPSTGNKKKGREGYGMPSPYANHQSHSEMFAWDIAQRRRKTPNPKPATRYRRKKGE